MNTQHHPLYVTTIVTLRSVVQLGSEVTRGQLILPARVVFGMESSLELAPGPMSAKLGGVNETISLLLMSCNVLP